MAATTWRKELINLCGDIVETFESAIIGDPVINEYGRIYKFNALPIDEWTDPRFQTFLDTGFDSGHGGENGIPFRIYTKDAIYFSHSYDGAESVEYVYRDPSKYLGDCIHTIS